MKTILYQPLFINPQAYFVFPQLYHIEKGDSYIESANITGQLIINDLTKSLTSTLISKCDSTSEIVYSNQSLFGTQRVGFNSNYELHDGHLIQYDNIYAIHDEGSGEDSYYKHVYDNLIVEYIKGEHTQYLSKPLGCGSNLHADIIIKNCIFKNGKENVSDVSWHFSNNANYKFTITGNRFSYRFSFDSNVTKCNVLFTNNSHKEDNAFANATVVQFNNVKE